MADVIETTGHEVDAQAAAIEPHDAGTVCAVCGVRFPAAIAVFHARACSARVRGDDEESTRVFVDRAHDLIDENAAYAASLGKPRNRMHRVEQDGTKVVRFFKRILFP